MTRLTQVSNRDALLAGAKECLRTKGYARTTARDLVAASARLGDVHGRTLAGVVGFLESPVSATDAARDFARYLAAAEALVSYVDQWHS